jgi:hypothetical protein
MRSPASRTAEGEADAMGLAHTDWLRHDLVVSGPPAAIVAFQAAAAGAGAIPWHYPDLGQDEEDRVHALLHPPDGSPGLRLAAARVLARQLHEAVAVHQDRVAEAAGRSRACPFDLHALVPVPASILRLGPEAADSIAWLRAHWGVVRALRHVRRLAAPPDRRLRRSSRLGFAFWSADWTPWAAFRAIGQAWPTLVFDLRPDYGDG